ncbi:DMT family transporter [Moritella sp. F3]|uniref:DMT family transporter n=1 Tax=Moritella sp. F3 TaxID=2718882 RepID=UPI0018E12C06|nr:DMT family transporter [Moritella sp. F3]GIC76494.1 permease [Moritella sp. F1]GIC80837.1 permease [Moritella sp. F3]
MEQTTISSNSTSTSKKQRNTRSALRNKLSAHKIGLLCAFFATCLFSTKGIFVKLAYQYGVDSITLMTYRMLLSLPFYIGVFAWMITKTPTLSSRIKAQFLPVMGIGFLGYYLSSYFDLEGLNYISSQLERLLLFTYPTVVVILSWLIFGNRINRQVIGALILAYAGVFVLFYHDLGKQGEGVITGSLLVLTACFTFACYLLLSKSKIQQLGSLVFTCIAMFGASFMIFVHFSVVHDIKDLSIPLPVFWISLWLAIGCTVIPSFLMSEGIARVGPEQASIVGGSGPVLTALMAVFLLGEAFTVYHFLGMLMVIVAIVWLSVRK